MADDGRQPLSPRFPVHSLSGCGMNLTSKASPRPSRRLTVRPDAPPTLAVATPSDLKETSPDDLLTVAIVAHDDVAVASAELHYTIERANGSTGPCARARDCPLQGLGTPSAR